jgi:hypothetical protein
LRIWPLAVGVAVLALPAAGAWFEVSPQSPTSETPITITFIIEPLGDCGPTTGEVTVAGKAVHVRLFRTPGAPSCPPTIAPRAVSMKLGTLPIGQYTLSADYSYSQNPSFNVEWSGRFVVRNPTPFMSLPMTSRAGGLPIRLNGTINEVSASFGGVPATSYRQEDDGLVAIAPPHEPGLYDVEITGPNGQHSEIPGGIYYFDGAKTPDLTMFEPVLFPVLDSASGAFGTRWIATATIQNNGGYVETFNRIDQLECIARPCFELRAPHFTFDFRGIGYPHGAVLYVPRQAHGTLAYGLRIVDQSNPDDIGFELKPVRESQFFREVMTLLNVPIGADYRTKLRIYALDPLIQPYVSISVSGSSDLRHGWAAILSIKRSANVTEPAYAELDLQSVSELQGINNATISIAGPTGGPVWAFASAVHNKSQRTIIITPQ